MLRNYISTVTSTDSNSLLPVWYCIVYLMNISKGQTFILISIHQKMNEVRKMVSFLTLFTQILHYWNKINKETIWALLLHFITNAFSFVQVSPKDILWKSCVNGQFSEKLNFCVTSPNCSYCYYFSTEFKNENRYEHFRHFHASLNPSVVWSWKIAVHVSISIS